MSHAYLLMAYGSPDTPDEVEPYFTHIRHGRTPSADAVANLRARYAAVGGRTPLSKLTADVANKLRARLQSEGVDDPVYVGMKHWHPFIGEAVKRMAADGITEATALVLAPHYSRMSIGQYRDYADKANAELAQPVRITFIESWHRQPEFLALMASLVRNGLAQFPAEERGGVTVVFTAHSLPERIRQWGDPYEAELLDSARAVADTVGLRDWRWAWQSAGNTGDPWLGPDILDYLDTLASEGVTRVLQVPIGFVSEHLEVLYDIDIEARRKAESLGMRLERTELPNARDEFIAAVRAAFRDAGSAHQQPGTPAAG
jgi:protoporphyrin/coproporphyrin ferrochelatase